MGTTVTLGNLPTLFSAWQLPFLDCYCPQLVTWSTGQRQDQKRQGQPGKDPPRARQGKKFAKQTGQKPRQTKSPARPNSAKRPKPTAANGPPRQKARQDFTATMRKFRFPVSKEGRPRQKGRSRKARQGTKACSDERPAGAKPK